ncbi:MAG: ribonuclease III [Lachnospiraceae bacterium]|jgi:RNAse III (EC 3.1.26.3)|nr:ribonuclease III [Lachnospiraceae bacterium]
MMETQEILSILQQRIGYSFHDSSLLLCAITHPSYMNERKINKWQHYQRLEYLGDAVLELVMSEYLYFENPEMPEGELSKMRASMVCEPALAYCAAKLSLGELILLGKGEDATGGRKRDSILSDVFEAIIGAVYLDGGFEAAKKHIYRFVMEGIGERRLFVDSKSILQEEIQKTPGQSIRYELIGEDGPEHDKTFTVALYINDECKVQASGHSKKNAEQKAAYELLLQMRGNS